MKKFNEYSKPDFSLVNKEMLEAWESENLFHQSLQLREGSPRYVFYDGPPSANGMPGIHHVVARSLKDIFCRYKTMQGFLVERRAGWDTHGLPVELGVEKKLGINKFDIGKKISVAEYNEACKKEVMTYTREWELLTKKMGYWVDMNDPYVTYSTQYIESIWWLLAQLHKKGLLYKGYTIQPYSPAAGTGLSSHELNLPGCYRDVKDTMCTAQFRVLTPKKEWENWGEPYFLAWTTTPWTLPSNTALCVGPNITYVAIETFNPYSKLPVTVILAEARVAAYFNEEDKVDVLPESVDADAKKLPWRTIQTYKGTDLLEIQYEQLIPWVNPGEGAFRVIPGDYVTTEDGTGIVHIAPTFGQDDKFVAEKAGVPPLTILDRDGNERPMVDLKGRFIKVEGIDKHFAAERMDLPLYDVYAGRYVKNDYSPTPIEGNDTLDIDLCVMLKMQNKAFRIEKQIHNYPHCWRTDKPILYYPLESWFIKATAVRDEMIQLNKTINWKPEAIGSGRFAGWLENLQDWNLSRSRFWGTPLNIWRTEDGSEELCIASIEELLCEIDKAVAHGLMQSNPYKGFVVGDMSKENYNKVDLHRPIVDDIVLLSSQGKPMYREKDLIDVWFDSGAMPFAQEHYPFENKQRVDSGDSFPADFIAEGVDQTRGWFYTLHAIATMVKGSVAFKNVLVNGLVQDKNGNKMSKRLGNAVDPFTTIDLYGSDTLRWYLITNAQPWDNIKFNAEGIKEVTRKFFGTLYNTYQFFALYANLDGFQDDAPLIPNAERPEIDRWIRSKLHTLVADVTADLDQYEPTRAARRVEEFVAQHLSNWYVRLSRRRFWVGEMTNDKLSAYQTLFECLLTIAKLIAPIAPFYADRLYRDLTCSNNSVHLQDFPVSCAEVVDKKLEANMAKAQQISSMVLALRRKVNIKVRFPLAAIMLPVSNKEEQDSIDSVSSWILSEVNVKEIRYVDANEKIWQHTIKPDFRLLGPKYGKIMKQLANAISGMTNEEIHQLDAQGYFMLNVEGEEIRLDRQDVAITVQDIPGWLVLSESGTTVALDVTLTDELTKEGLAREFVNRIQNLRKQLNFEVNDRIEIVILGGTDIDGAVESYKAYICEQTQADALFISDAVSDATSLDFDGFTLDVAITKVQA